MHNRLRRARLLAGYNSARAAIERFGWKPSTYRAHENGQNKFRASDAAAYARAFGVSPSWLLFGEQGPGLAPVADRPSDPDLNIRGRAGGTDTTRTIACDGHFDLTLDSDELSEIARCGDILRFATMFDLRALSDGDIVALERRTESGVDILPRRVFFHHGKTLFEPPPASPAETVVDARILGKAIWLLRQLAL